MTAIDCSTCRSLLPDLLAHRGLEPSSVSAHLVDCAGCRQTAEQLRNLWAALDEWKAPEPSAYFDARLHARLRAAQAAPHPGLWERLSSYLAFSTGRHFRPAMAGALGVAMLLGGGTAATLLTHHGASATASPTVNDLRIYDNNAQALQQMDLLDEAGSDPGGAPQS